MKRPFAFFFLFLLGVILLIVPHLIISSPEMKSSISRILQKELDAEAEFSDLTWYWFPMPHIVFRDAKIHNEDFSLDALQVGVYPDWISLFYRKPAIAQLDLEDFHFVLRKIGRKENKKLVLPRCIRATNGFFELDKGLNLPLFPFKDKRPYIKNLYGEVRIDGASLSAKLRGNTRQASAVELQGSADLEDLTYRLKCKVDQLNIAALRIKKVTSVRQFPAYGFVNVELDVEGKGLESSKGRLTAYSNCFVSKARSRSAVFSCGSLSMRYVYKKEEANITLENLEFERPRLRVKGRARIFKRGSAYWAKADLSGGDLELGQIRDVLYALSIKDKDVRDFCTAIRGGKVRQATLHLDAPLPKWHSLSDMYIRGSAENVKVYVKDKDFFVDSASGPFEIRQGVLYAKDVRASLRKTIGTSGRLVLGLSKGCEQFKLDIMVNAPAADVKWALVKFTHEKRLHEEISKISKLKGRLQGRLLIGDRKHDKKVKVLVQKSRLSFFYETLGMGIQIKKGAARYQEDVDALFLSGLSGSLGPNSFTELSGRVSWKNRQFDIKVDRAKGRMLAESLFGLCKRFDIATDFFREKGIDVSGPFVLNRLKLHVRLDDVSSMTYLVSFSPAGLSLHTNMLPRALLLSKGQIRLTPERVTARSLRMRLARDWFDFSADLFHERFQKWKGYVKTSGIVRRALWGWLEEKGLHLDEFTPRLPFSARNFKVVFGNGKKKEFQGSLTWKRKGISLKIKGFYAPGRLNLEYVKISQGENACSISFFRSLEGEKALSFSFRGVLRKEVLDAVLQDNRILDGAAEGDFDAAFSSTKGSRIYKIKGRFQASALHWIWAGVRGFSFKRLFVSEKDSRVDVNSVLRVFGDDISLNGSFETQPSGLTGAAKLSATKVSAKTFGMVQEFANEEKGVERKRPSSGGGQDEAVLFKEMAKGLRVRIDFDLDEVRYAVTEFHTGKNTGPHELVLKHLKGQAALDGMLLNRIEAYSDDTCGLDLYLKKVNEKGMSRSEFSAITPQGHPARFEQVLDCMGIKQDLITGPVTMNLYLRGKDKVLLGNGSLKIRARDGYIHKFGLLSKIFSVVNIVDIFSLNKGLLEGTSPYKRLLVDAKIKSGRVHMEKAYIKGQGINFYGTGDVYLDKKTLDLIIFIQPLKTVDKIITSLPIIGGIIGGENKSLFAIPVQVSGNWSDPKVDTLQTRTVTDIFKKLIFNVLTAPFTIRP